MTLKMMFLRRIYKNNMQYIVKIDSKNFPKRSDKRPESKHGRPESSKYQLERR